MSIQEKFDKVIQTAKEMGLKPISCDYMVDAVGYREDIGDLFDFMAGKKGTFHTVKTISFFDICDQLGYDDATQDQLSSMEDRWNELFPGSGWLWEDPGEGEALESYLLINLDPEEV